MVIPSCKIYALLASTDSDNNFNQKTIDLLKPAVQEVITKSNLPVSRALFIYYAAGSADCENTLKANIQKLFDKNITVECIVTGQEEEMIDNAECIVVGGGDMKELTAKIAAFGSNIWKKVLSGTPFVGINVGAEFLSSVYITIPAGTVSNFNFFPIQFLVSYTDSAADRNKVQGLFNHNPLLKYVLAMPTDQEGGGITMEEAKTGLAGTDGSGSGSGGGPVGGQNLYIYRPDGQGGFYEVPWTPQQTKDLPINYL